VADLVHDAQHRLLTVGRSLFDEADELAVSVPASCRRTGRCRECVVEIVRGAEALSPRTPAEAFLPRGFRLACQALIERTDQDVEFAVLRRRLRILMPSEPEPGEVFELDVPIGRDGAPSRDSEPLGPADGRMVGLAIDLGTTTVVLEVVDLESGRSLHAAAFENPQRFGGSDVMSRIGYDSEHPGELRRALRRALNRELEATYRLLGLDRHEVREAVVVGNPTMRDLFFGLDVGPLGRWPFRSLAEIAVREGRASTSGLVRRAHEIGMLIHPQGRVIGVPLIACHVGADAAADLVAIGFASLPGVSLMIDIGTNTEVVIGDGERILAASSPAGPAFEGGGVSYGMAGADGAIEAARWENGLFVCRTIGDLPAQGICGSGLVDLLAESRRAGLLKPNGSFDAGARTIPVLPERGIELSRADVSALAQAKAAITACQLILMRRLGITPQQIDRVFLAGAFATALDATNAMAIGLLVRVPVARVQRVGNASVRGAKALLLSGRRRRELDLVLARIEHVELESELDFFELFVDGCRFEACGPPMPVDSP
jgi:uncharacterized 2Fe-2S/4Fe-4S cluster protein (DUF4445 family)